MTDHCGAWIPGLAVVLLAVVTPAPALCQSAKPDADEDRRFAVWVKRWDAEQTAIKEITRLGGWVKTEAVAPDALRKRLGDKRSQFVVEVNMVYHYDKDRKRSENHNYSDEAVQHVKHFTQLKLLLLAKTQATDDNLKHLAGMPRLERLYMWDASKVTDKGFAWLRDVESLKYIHCGNSGITDKALAELQEFEELEGLSLQGNRFTNKALEHVGGLTNLKSLVLGLGDAKAITDEGLAQLKNLTQLTRLGLQNTSVTDKGLKHLYGMPNLRTLWLSRSGVTDAGVAELRRVLPKVKVVK